MPEVPSTSSDHSTDENHVLTLQCPSCKGSLSLKPDYVGVAGQCVHCQLPIIAIRTEAGVQIVENSVSRQDSSLDGVESSRATRSEPDLSAPSQWESGNRLSPDSSGAIPSSLNSWGFPPREESGAKLDDVILAPSDDSSVQWDIDDPIPTRDGDDLFAGRPGKHRREPSSSKSPFDQLEGLFSQSESSIFNPDKEEPGISTSWGTQMPTGNHASISPFRTGSADSGSFAEDLYLEKVQKENAEAAAGAEKVVESHPSPPRPVPACDLAFGMPTTAHAGAFFGSEPAPAEVFPQSSPVKLPIKPTVEDGSKIFAASGTGRSGTAIKLALRMIIALIIMALIGMTAYITIPREMMTSWKERAIEWLEPGTTGIELLPEVLKPKEPSPSGTNQEIQSKSEYAPPTGPRQNPLTKSEIPPELNFD